MVQVINQPDLEPVPVTDRPFLAADIGGTHVRVGILQRDLSRAGIRLLAYQSHQGARHANLSDILRSCLHNDAFGADTVSHGVLACTGYVVNGVVINDSLPWTVDILRLRRELRMDRLQLINDFQALAHGIGHMDSIQSLCISDCTEGQPNGPIVVLGPGTGLGSALILPAPAPLRVLPSEAGQSNFAPGTPLEVDILNRLAKYSPYVSYEHVLSGPGLMNLYRALCERYEQKPVFERPEDISYHAIEDNDVIARQSLEVFCAILGSFAGNLAMIYNASGGVYLAGGIPSHIQLFLERSDFMSRFLDKGSMNAFLRRVPVRLIEHGKLAVFGAAHCYLKGERSCGAETS